jgi:hypothetical protein
VVFDKVHKVFPGKKPAGAAAGTALALIQQWQINLKDR